jgi:hypothetical protein
MTIIKHYLKDSQQILLKSEFQWFFKNLIGLLFFFLINKNLIQLFEDTLW